MADLEEQLRNYGAALERVIDNDDRTVPVVSRSSSRSTGRYAAIALVVASVAGAIMFVRLSDQPSAAVPAATPFLADTIPGTVAAAETVPSSVDTTTTDNPQHDWAATAVNACIEQVQNFPDTGWRPPTAKDEVVLIPLGHDPVSTRVIVTGDDSQAECTVTATADAPTATDISFAKRRDLVPVDTDSVVIDNEGWQSNTAEGTTGPGWFVATGRVGTNVVGLTLVLSDGTSTEASLSGGHFYGKVVAAKGVPLFKEVLNWTLTDGTTHSSQAALLDTPTPAEQCAATAGCVEARLDELQGQAAGIDAEVLADRTVTDAEYEAALQRLAACANAAGGTVTVVGLTIRVEAGTDQSMLDGCQTTVMSLIQEARDLVIARDALAADHG